MFSKSLLRTAIAASWVAPTCALAELEISAELKNETAIFAKSGQLTGQARTTLDERGNSNGDLMKFENSARIFINGEIGEESTWHAELRPVWNPAAETADYEWHRNYTQNDYLRELYWDTSFMDWDLRLGKQQVVWGTADGIKLLDIINPTDFSELNQNAFEDSRIPVWMVNAESNIGERGNIQLILSQAETNKVAGLWTQDDGATRTTTSFNAGTDTYTFIGNGEISGRDRGHPFIMNGVDVITGGVNGFFNIGAGFGSVTNTFFIGGAGGSFTDPGEFANALGTTVGGFTSGEFVLGAFTNPATCAAPVGVPGTGISGAACLEIFTEGTNQDVLNLVDVAKDTTNPTGVSLTGSGWDVTNPNSAWEHFPNASFATFNAMVGMNTRYERAYDDDVVPSDANVGGRFRSYLDNGLNYSVNYFYGYDANPHVNIHWENSRGERLFVSEAVTVPGGTAGRDVKVLQIHNADKTEFYGANADFIGTPDLTNVTAANNGGPATLVFVEDRNRIHNLGGSFDFATEAGDIPLVIRGEFLYQKDVMQPVIDRGALTDGNLVRALRSEEHDFFKYVIGVDATVLTNLLVSGQFIQFRNLDFVDDRCSYSTQGPTGAPGTGAVADCSRYTGDPAVMNVTNGLKRGYENKEFYSLFLSKPFGENQLGRWNNIIIYEEGGGYWNRLDAEYSVSDELIISGEINFYFGDDETLFGQFENSSSVQVGLKYIIE